MLIDFKAVAGTKTKVLDELRLTLTLFSIPLLSATARLSEGLPAISGLLSAFSPVLPAIRGLLSAISPVLPAIRGLLSAFSLVLPAIR